MSEFGFFSLLPMAALTFPLAFLIARFCLAGVIRVLERHPGRQ